MVAPALSTIAKYHLILLTFHAATTEIAHFSTVYLFI